MKLDRPLRFRGEIVWLAAEQGGRTSGPPATPDDQDYAASAYVPPAAPDQGLASFVLRVQDRGSWRSDAEADWLVVPNEGAHRIEPGTLVVVTEGPAAVAYFHVNEVV